MPPILRNILAVLAGLIFGSIVNMGLIMISGSIIPPPSGADVTTMEGLKSSIHLFEPKHFLMPFLAHALGTFAGAGITSLLAVNHKILWGLGIGGAFLIGGISNVLMIPSPLWFNVIDVVFAYLPMAFFASKLLSPPNKNGL
ncbi:MAG: hypothetical protein K2Q22_05025 [Cytophagales bacterium]|nr:hypothetical protein [Cytophagales bacterium]